MNSIFIVDDQDYYIYKVFSSKQGVLKDCFSNGWLIKDRSSRASLIYNGEIFESEDAMENDNDPYLWIEEINIKPREGIEIDIVFILLTENNRREKEYIFFSTKEVEDFCKEFNYTVEWKDIDNASNKKYHGEIFYKDKEGNKHFMYEVTGIKMDE